MILYVNGDSHTAAAEAVNPYCFAQDDPLYYALGRQPHPDNERVSYGCILANAVYAILHNDAESASSNERILRTTQEYLKETTPDAIVIGWATWEREEFLIDGTYYQFSAGRGQWANDWPVSVEKQYKEWVLSADPNQRAGYWHDTIYAFHKELEERKIPHLFFNTFHAFNHNFIQPIDWNGSYVEPYSHDHTYYHWLQQQGHTTVNANSYHYGPKSHHAWADFLLYHLTNLL